MVMPFNHPVYKLNMNLGIQCNYNLPWNASEFYNPPYWQQKRDLSSAANDTRFKRDLSAGEFYGALEVLVQE